jgi:hypothetical protein
LFGKFCSDISEVTDEMWENLTDLVFLLEKSNNTDKMKRIPLYSKRFTLEEIGQLIQSGISPEKQPTEQIIQEYKNK